ncbi:MAG: hypothetical protein B1H04_01125 [Planctomycetales bacterium 4484_123]|nr:MAG: hypothetical protein B1H04_01125 [Planctomycetales bacterium 4484_123]
MLVTAEKASLLWISPDGPPPGLGELLGRQWEVTPRRWTGSIAQWLDEAEVAVISPPGDGSFDLRDLSRLLDEVDRSQAVAVVLLPPHLPADNLLVRRRGRFVLVPADVSADGLAARIDAAAALQPVIRHLQADLESLRSFNGTGELEDLDEELRLAARLQRDFLPQRLPEVGPIRFAALFRPATWVSGDIYDVFRLDENHVGFYVADVVGHGLPAALLTIFLKKSLQTKRILGHSYEIVSPPITLALLNDDICQQGLTSCQFCTAWYGIVDARTLRLRCARGGHPPALLLSRDQPPRQLAPNGPLLGVFPGETFQPMEVALRPGQRVVVYSDGAEEALRDFGAPERCAIGEVCEELLELPPEEMALQLTARIDQRRAEAARCDDITVVVMDVQG